MVPHGLEPWTPWLWVRCSNQLSYGTEFECNINTNFKTPQEYYSLLTTSWHNSISTPLVDFGWRNTTSLLSAPFFGFSFKTMKSSFFNLETSNSKLSTSKAIWCIPSPFFLINFAIGLSSFVASKSSILLSPTLKKEQEWISMEYRWDE